MKQLILMADIVASRSKDQIQVLHDFKKAVKFTNQKFKSQVVSPLTITLGDEFQGVISDVNAAVQIIIELEEFRIHHNNNYQLRYVLHQGSIETAINTTIAYEMLGPGLTEARAKLNNLKREKQRFHISLDNTTQTDLLNESFVIFDTITQKWKPSTDFELVSEFLKLTDYKRVAEHFQKSRSQIWKREKSLNIGAYRAIKNIINKVANL